MHDLEKKMIEYYIIDSAINQIYIDEWFENVTITYNSGDSIGKVACDFLNCFRVSFEHDKNYSKGKNNYGGLDYTYFIQNIEVTEDGGFYVFNISAWPLDGQIICRRINIKSLSQ